MFVSRVNVENVRNLTNVTVEPVPGLNVIAGRNGSGKTSLLEAIHFAGVGRSFRTRRSEQVIRRGEERLLVHVTTEGELGRHSLGVARSRSAGASEIRIDRQAGKGAAALAALLPLLVIAPNSHELVEGAPGVRRGLLDWGVFHVEQTFHGDWFRYQRALKQANAAMKRGDSTDEWLAILSGAGARIDRAREDYVTQLSAAASALVSQLLPGVAVSMEYRRGWPKDTDLKAALTSASGVDRDRGFISVGPHRADLGLRTDGVSARDVLSRGQQKLLVYGLKLAQAVLMARQRGFGPVALFDDLPAELDAERREWVLQQVAGLGLQAFVTATDAQHCPRQAFESSRVFHVEQGRVHKVV